MTTTPPFVVTIGRLFGSGGRQIGRLVAERLGVPFYDKELLAEAARASGVSIEFFEKRDERQPSLLSGIFSFSMGHIPVGYYTGLSCVSDDGIYCAYADFIRQLAATRSCVIVGRTSDYILRDNPRCINIFLHAPIDACVDRILSREAVKDRRAAANLARKMNSLRAAYYNFYTDKTWGDAASYHLSIDSSTLPPEQIADLIVDYVNRHLAAR